MTSKMKKILIGIIIAVFGFVFYLFLFNKLFTYSPIIIGFTKHELTNTIIYVQKRTGYNDLTRIDTLIPSIENFHDLKFIRKPEIFIFRDSLSFINRSFSKARFSAYPSGRLIISPWALKEDQQGIISLEIFVRHELSHVLIFQHKGILAELRYPKWLLEGTAVYSTNQMGTSFYPSKNETYHAIAQGNFLPPFDFKTKREDIAKLNVKYRIAFMYSEFACIVDYLVVNYGKDKFLSYMKSLIKSNDHDKIFKQIYGIDFNELLIDFRQSVEENDTVKTTK
jgi:predicted SprT family Zn-dependent metalloprotease